jgi:hypothetical protein
MQKSELEHDLDVDDIGRAQAIAADLLRIGFDAGDGKLVETLGARAVERALGLVLIILVDALKKHASPRDAWGLLAYVLATSRELEFQHFFAGEPSPKRVH